MAGWFKERFHKNMRVMADLTASTEYHDTIAVHVTNVDYDGNASEAGVTYEFCLLDDNGVLAVSTSFTLSVGAGLTAVSTDAKARLIATVATAGGVLTVTDVATGSGATLHLKATPLNGPGYVSHLELAFD